MICNLCKKEIIVEEDKYVHVEDYEKEKKKSEMWMHYECFKKAMNKDLNQLQKQAQEMLSRASGIFNSEQFNEIFPQEKVVKL
jgi:uncharacterized SAM-dependent methyltransferase|tara:strand:+ start:135 stop:383 length:249 start_codon:yes stop_codon:yes gene_type:complete